MSMPRAFPPTFTPTQYLAEHLLFPVTGVLLALPAVFGHPDRGLVRRLLGTRILQWFGLVSYGVFLWHEPLLRRLARAGGEDLIPGMPFASLLLLTTLAATACAAASYYLLERPILRFKDGRRRSRPAEAVPAPASAG
jgi:peptidoglycan/LPS O-acetylase OafA/YrhL